MLNDEQKAKVQEWIAAGLKLSEIQDRLAKEYELRLSYMDLRLLVDDLKLTPKDPVQPEPAKPAAPDAPETEPGLGAGEPANPDAAFIDPLAEGGAGAGGGVAVTVDQITRAGAMVSGHVTFSDGKTADWYIDQTGRFGLIPPEPGYRPSQADLAEFQGKLDRELAKIGY